MDAYEEFVVALIEERKDVTVDEMGRTLVGRAAGEDQLQHLAHDFAAADGPLKKTAHALERDWQDVLKRRRVWFDGQLDLDPEKLIFIDESGLSTKMSRLRGHAPRGERCRAGVPHGIGNNDIHRHFASQ